MHLQGNKETFSPLSIHFLIICSEDLPVCGMMGNGSGRSALHEKMMER
jgi:hypothetical protein